MGETTYTVEKAKSGRAKCKKCKDPIGQGDLRIGSHAEASGGYNMSSWYHPACFNLPRKYSAGAGKMSPEAFVQDILQDTSNDGSILPARAEELAEAIGSKAAGGGSTKKKASEGGGGDGLMAKLKKDYAKFAEEEGDEPRSPKKQRKGEDKNQLARLRAYGDIHKKTIPELKDILRWNKQVLTGTKEVLMAKIIDGAVYGRLAYCPLCDHGRLKLEEDGQGVVCMGTFDEDIGRRITCSFKGNAADVPRWQPWYMEQPSEEETEEMEKQIAIAKGEMEPDGAGDDDPVVQELIERASKTISEWDLMSKNGPKAAAKALIAKVFKNGSKTLDIPQDAAEALQKVGPILVRDRTLTAAEVIPVIVKEFGFVEDKKAKAAKKESAIEEMVGHAKNAPIIAAFRELGELYAKEGNRNAAGAYLKAVEALSALDFEITEDNCMSLSKGKTKVPGIGKSTAEKMLELLSTGTMSKLEEKRLEAS